MRLNEALLAREKAAELGCFDPRPEPPLPLTGTTRLQREIDEAGRETWRDLETGVEFDAMEIQKRELAIESDDGLRQT